MSDGATWLLRFSVGGTFYNYATKPVDVTSVVDGVIRFDAGLMTDNQPRSSSASVKVVGKADWSLIAQQSGGLTGNPVSLKRLVDLDTIWERALAIVSDGEIKSARYDDAELTLSISQIKRQTPVVPPTQVVDATTHPTAPDDKVIGQVYPRVYGYPGFRSIGVPRPVVPALLVLNGLPVAQQLLFSGHSTEVQRNSGDVQLWRTSDPIATAVAPVFSSTDALGQGYSYVNGVPIPVAVSDELYIGFSLSEGGGLVNQNATGSIRGAGEVLLDLLRLTGDKVDSAAMRAQFSFLNAYKLDFFINEGRSSAQQAIASIVDVLPVTEQRTSDGLYYQAWNWRAKRTDAVTNIDVQRDGWSIVGGVEEPEFTPYNKFTLEYGFDRVSEGAVERRIMAPKIDPADSRVRADWKCAASLAKYGTVYELTPVAVSILWDDATAQLMLSDMAAEHCLPRPIYTYTAPIDDTQVDRFRGAIAIFTDADVHINERLVLLWPVSYGVRTTIAVHLLPQVPTDTDRA